MYTEMELDVLSNLVNRMQGKFKINLGMKINQTCFRQEIKKIL